MKCPDIAPLVTRFFDGELDGPHMRTVALHITRCRDCEAELRTLEKVQDLVVAQAAAEVEGIDLDSIWAGISSEIDATPLPWTERLRVWWDEFELLSPMTVWPAVAAAAAFFLTLNFWDGGGSTFTKELAKPAVSTEINERVADVGLAHEAWDEVVRWLDSGRGVEDNSAVFESIVGGVDGLVIEPKHGTAVLVIGDDGEFR